MDKKNPNLSSVQKLVMFEDGTEPPGSSELNNEKRKGSYHCANCGVKLFDSQTKYESGSGWPSFYQSLPDVFETKTDHLIVKVVKPITDTFLMMDQSQLVKDIVIMEFV